MNKKILIATVFTTLILTLPLTSVIGVSDTTEDCNCQVLNRESNVRYERLLFRLENSLRMLLLVSNNNPEIVYKCQEILDVINSEGPWDTFCDNIVYVMETIIDLIEIYGGIFKLLTPVFAVLLSLWFWFCWLY